MIDVDKRFIDINENTRPGDKIRQTHKIIFHDAPLKYNSGIKNRNYINSLKNQDNIFMSYHYIIGSKGEIIQLIPEDEIAIHTGFIEFDLHSISIALCYDKNKKKILTTNTLNSLKYLSKYLLKKYKLDSKYDLIKCYDVINKRSPIYFVENPYIFYDFKISLNQLCKFY